MKKADVEAQYIMRGVPPHGLSVKVGWCVSPRGRIQPYVLPPKTYINEQLYSMGSYMPQIRHVVNGRPLIFSQDRRTRRFSKGTVRRLNKNAKGWLQE